MKRLITRFLLAADTRTMTAPFHNRIRKVYPLMAATLILSALTISFAVPTFAQQKDTANSRIAQQHDLIGDSKALDEFGVLATKQSDAFTNKDAAAVAALFTEDAVLVAPDGIFSGRQAIEKRYEDTFQQWPLTLFNDPRDCHLKTIDNAVWSFGEWSGSLQTQTGPEIVHGYFSAIYVLESDAWKIRMLTLTERPRPAEQSSSKQASSNKVKAGSRKH